MRSIPAFSKKSSPGPTVGGNGQRSGFTEHVKVTNLGKPKAVPHMAATYPTASTLNRTSGHSKAPAFNNSGSGKAAKSVAAFSKKSVKGTPKRTPGH
jgi:hypothetical protein